MSLESQFRTLIINPRLNSTHIGIFDHKRCIFEQDIVHENKNTPYQRVADQTVLRKEAILDILDYEGINISKISAVGAIGGLLRPIEGGTYKVNAPMLYDLKTAQYGEHVSNLGGIIAHDIASGLNIDAYIVDPVVVDELDDVARISGVPEIERKSIFHALNQKAAARKAAAQLRVNYEDINLIIIHMGRGITIGAHHKGKVIDVNNGLNGDGPFTPERAGSIPIGDLMQLCYSGHYTMEELIDRLTNSGGLIGYLQTANLLEVETRIKNGDTKAGLVYQAMAYQIAKEIGAMSAVLSGEVNAIVFTGILAEATTFTELISQRINWIADIFVYPGENVLNAINESVLRVLENIEESKEYIHIRSELL